MKYMAVKVTGIHLSFVTVNVTRISLPSFYWRALKQGHLPFNV